MTLLRLELPGDQGALLHQPSLRPGALLDEPLIDRVEPLIHPVEPLIDSVKSLIDPIEAAIDKIESDGQHVDQLSKALIRALLHHLELLRHYLQHPIEACIDLTKAGVDRVETGCCFRVHTRR